MEQDGTWRFSATSGTFTRASRYKGFNLTKAGAEREPSPATYDTCKVMRKLHKTPCITNCKKPTLGKETMYECVGNSKILQKNYMNKKEK